MQSEPQKVASYVGYIRSVEARALACKAEKERYAELQRRAEASVERMKANVLATMQRFEIKAMVDTRTGQGFRRQGNGGRERIWFSPHCLKPKQGLFSELMGLAMRDADEAAERYLIAKEEPTK